MATGSTAPRPRRLRDVFAGLFAEALELERRRRRRVWVLALLVGGAVAGGAFLFESGGRGAGVGPAPSARAVPSMVLASRTLPVLGGNPLLSVAGKRLVISDTDNTRFVDGRVTGVSAAATVDPASLRMISFARGGCGDPSLYDRHVIAVSYVPTVHDHTGWGVNPMAMRISVATRSGAGYRVGPVIVTYPDGSDMRAETIQGGGSLWVYAPLVGARLRHAELLRVSLATGQVIERWRMPPITRALLATNADGLWLAPSNESGYSAHATAAQQIAQASLYHVTPGANKPARVFDVGVWGARWLVAHGESVWLARGPANRAPTLWRFEGPHATPVLRGARALGGVQECGDLGDGPVTVMGSSRGILCATNPNPNTEHVQWLSATGGHSSVVATVPTHGEWEFEDNAVLDDGGYYFVEPTANNSLQSGKPVLYRVAPKLQ